MRHGNDSSKFGDHGSGFLEFRILRHELEAYFKGALPKQYGFVFDQRALRLVVDWIHFLVLDFGLLGMDWQHDFPDLNWSLLRTAQFAVNGGLFQFLDAVVLLQRYQLMAFPNSINCDRGSLFVNF